MQKANALDTRNNLKMAHAMADAGINFICVPTLGYEDTVKLVANVEARLAILEKQASE